MKVLAFVLLNLVFYSTSFAAPSWHSWPEVQPLPEASEIDFSRVRSVEFEVYDINAVRPEVCPGHCFRAAVYVNGELLGVVPTSPGSTRYSWGGRTPEFRNAKVVKSWGYKGYRMHPRGYISSRGDNLRYFLVFEHNGRPTGIGFHGDKGGAYPVTGEPESHGCLRLTDNNAYIFNMLARAVLDNTGSVDSIRLNAYHTRRYRF